MRKWLMVLLVFCLTSVVVDADQYWPQWRGPAGTGVAPEGDPPVAWSEDKNIRWKVELPGGGHATPIVWSDQVFVSVAVRTDNQGASGESRRGVQPTQELKYEVMALDRKTGKVVWQKTARQEMPHEGRKAEGSWASPSAVTDGKYLYVSFGSRGLYCYDLDGRFEQMGDAIDTWFLQWQDVLAQYPFMAQYGNHEIYLKETYHDWAPRFAHPDGFDQNRNYSFKVGDVHITSLFLPGKNLTEEQLAWLDADLEAARKQNTRWLVVFQHESIYGHGTSHPTRPENRAALAPIFEAHGVDLHLSCHDQNYERTFPLTGVPDNPTPGSTDLHRYRQGQGVIYAKISPGGKMSEIGNQFSQFTTPQQPFMAVRDCTAHHYALVHVRDDLQLDTFSVTGDGTPKTLLDRFAISPPG